MQQLWLKASVSQTEQVLPPPRHNRNSLSMVCYTTEAYVHKLATSGHSFEGNFVGECMVHKLGIYGIMIFHRFLNAPLDKHVIQGDNYISSLKPFNKL